MRGCQNYADFMVLLSVCSLNKTNLIIGRIFMLIIKTNRRSMPSIRFNYYQVSFHGEKVALWKHGPNYIMASLWIIGRDCDPAKPC